MRSDGSTKLFKLARKRAATQCSRLPESRPIPRSTINPGDLISGEHYSDALWRISFKPESGVKMPVSQLSWCLVCDASAVYNRLASRHYSMARCRAATMIGKS